MIFLTSGGCDRARGKITALGEWRALFRLLRHAEGIFICTPSLCLISGFLATSEYCRLSAFVIVFYSLKIT